MAGFADGMCDVARADAKGSAESVARGVTLETVAAARSWLLGRGREVGVASYAGSAVSSRASALGCSTALAAAISVCGTVGRDMAASVRGAVACMAHGAAGAASPGVGDSIVWELWKTSSPAMEGRDGGEK